MHIQSFRVGPIVHMGKPTTALQDVVWFSLLLHMRWDSNTVFSNDHIATSPGPFPSKLVVSDFPKQPIYLIHKFNQFELIMLQLKLSKDEVFVFVFRKKSEKTKQRVDGIGVGVNMKRPNQDALLLIPPKYLSGARQRDKGHFICKVGSCPVTFTFTWEERVCFRWRRRHFTGGSHATTPCHYTYQIGIQTD